MVIMVMYMATTFLAPKSPSPAQLRHPFQDRGERAVADPLLDVKGGLTDGFVRALHDLLVDHSLQRVIRTNYKRRLCR